MRPLLIFYKLLFGALELCVCIAAGARGRKILSRWLQLHKTVTCRGSQLHLDDRHLTTHNGPRNVYYVRVPQQHKPAVFGCATGSGQTYCVSGVGTLEGGREDRLSTGAGHSPHASFRDTWPALTAKRCDAALNATPFCISGCHVSLLVGAKLKEGDLSFMQIKVICIKRVKLICNSTHSLCIVTKWKTSTQKEARSHTSTLVGLDCWEFLQDFPELHIQTHWDSCLHLLIATCLTHPWLSRWWLKL